MPEERGAKSSNDAGTKGLAKSPKNSRRYHHGGLRQALIDMGLVLISESGAQGLNLREAARRLKVSHNAYTRHFADRDTLLAAIALDGHRELRCSMDTAAAAEPTPLDKLKAAGQAYMLYALAHPNHYAAMYDHAYPLGKHPELDQVSYASFSVIQALVEQCQAVGLMLPGPSLTHTCLCWSTAHGVVSLINSDRMHFGTESEKVAYIQFVIVNFFGTWPRTSGSS